ncbi:MAG: tetratricopeptide repeat protein [Candidatus Methylacidiphilales bacterium]|nr:tetratricopeptide repeat protein [Candidatus Methylacidiphilales bacterium]
MLRFRPLLIVIPFVAALLLPPGHLQAQSAADLLQTGSAAYQAGDFTKAEQAFSRFLADYGNSPEAATQRENVLRLTGVCQIQLGKFGEAMTTVERYLREFPQGSRAEDFTFWRGVGALKLDDGKKAYEAFEQFLKAYPHSNRSEDARFSMGLALLRQDKFKETAEYFAKQTEWKPAIAYQVAVIRLHALIQSGQFDAAAQFLPSIHPEDEAAWKIAAYHLLALDLGNRLMEEDKYRPALGVLQRVWSKPRISARQSGRLENLQSQITKLSANPQSAGSYELLQLKDLAAQVGQDLAQLGKIPDYDTALQFRIARCFYELERPREAYLALHHMVSKMPEGPLLAPAGYTMMICLTRMERWDEAVAAADDFAKRFPKDKQLPAVLYLKAESLQRMRSYAEAGQTFRQVAEQFPDFPEAARCDFLAGYTLLLQNKNTEAAAHLAGVQERQRRSPFAEQALYWEAMATHFNKDYPKSREVFAEYLKKFPKGTNQADATYRRAQALFNQKLFTEAYKELEAFLKSYPDSTPYDEACNLLGDCYLALGEISRGLASYAKVSGRDSKLLEYGIFRTAQAYKAEEKYDQMLALFIRFTKERPQSPRLSEALSQLAWVYRRLEKPDKAVEIYWDAVERYGNDPEAPAVETMFKTLGRMNRAPEQKTALLARLSDMAEDALAQKKNTLAARIWWLRASLLEKESPEEASKLRLKIAATVPPRELSPLLLADVADELRKSAKTSDAALFYQTILSWYPLCAFKDRAYAGLGLLAIQEGNEKKALDLFAQFEREAGRSPLLAEVLQARAGLLETRGKSDEAVNDLEKVLQIPGAKGKPWVDALYRIGEIRMRQNDPKRAIPYFQRIYVMYGRWSDYVAKAYWQSGQAFEKLNMSAEAVNTYKEFVAQEHLGQTPEYSKAKERLKLSGGGA